MLLDPRCEVVGIEAEQMTPFHERDATLRDEPANVTLADTQTECHGGQI
jgi:hypothetical protein